MKHMTVPETISLMLRAGAALSISTSAGKDSQAMTGLLATLARQRHEWSGPIFNIHAHLGRAEWAESLPHAERVTKQCDIPLVIVQNEKGDLVDRVEGRLISLAGTGINPFMSAKQRFCTSEYKSGPINKYLRKFGLVVSAIGIRHEESKRRREKPVFQINQQLTSRRLKGLTVEEALRVRKPEQRLALIWHPIIEFSLDDVWEACGTSRREIAIRRALYREGKHAEALAGATVHLAYIRGAKRVSCAICILADKQTLIVGARHNPELLRRYREVERWSGKTFQPGRALTTLELCEPKTQPMLY
jgi:3'-phosphoadenosine 5'-phosphosulfate sulfotransferase (PAPS reductase)/FAD synthetase